MGGFPIPGKAKSSGKAKEIRFRLPAPESALFPKGPSQRAAGEPLQPPPASFARKRAG